MFTLNAMDEAGKVLNLIAKRQSALGQNLANMDTPGYTRKDVSFAKQLSGDSASSLENRLNQKLGGSPSFTEETGEEVNPSIEIMEMQKNSMLYSMATREMSSVITQMKTVINVGK